MTNHTGNRLTETSIENRTENKLEDKIENKIGTRRGSLLGKAFILVGAMLVLSALLLLFYNAYDAYRAGREAADVLEELQSSDADKIAMIDGYTYIGWLTIPDLELTLPVMADWDYKRLKLAPCRHFGAVETDDLVIAAHNYKTHFGRLSALTLGAVVTFTDLEGTETIYTLQKLDTISPDDVAVVRNSAYDLVLYTCTPGGAKRVAAFCDRISTI